MRDYWLYDPNANGTGISDLTAEESHHLVRVLRFREGDSVAGTNGRGLRLLGKIVRADAKHAIVEWRKSEYESLSRPEISLAIAPTKQIDRFEWFIEKATEMGIDEIVPIFTLNSERKKLRMDRLQKIVVAAVKQSKQTTVPRLLEPIQWETLCQMEFNGNRFIAHCHDGEKTELFRAIQTTQNARIAIGPEGDFTSDEVQMAINHNWKPVSLGKSRLRSETAGVIAGHTAVLKYST